MAILYSYRAMIINCSTLLFKFAFSSGIILLTMVLILYQFWCFNKLCCSDLELLSFICDGCQLSHQCSLFLSSILFLFFSLKSHFAVLNHVVEILQ